MMRKIIVPICLLLLTLSFPANGISLNVLFDAPEYDLTFGTSWDGSLGDIENVLSTSTDVNSLLASIYAGSSELRLKRVGLQTWTGSAVETNLLAEIAGYASKNAVGWYDTNSDASGEIYSGGSAPPDKIYTPFDGPKTFGFYLDPNGVPSARMSTEDSYRQAVVYEVLGFSNEYIIGFEDLSEPVSDKDYQDFVFRAKVAPVPEPATLILLGGGLIGLAGIGRKKFKK